jgi:hypothetical protein
MLVGATGLALALIGSLIGPVGILLQGQAWRWVWITRFISVLFIAPTIAAVWRHEKSGSLCAILAISAWTMSAIDGAACMSCALIVWSLRDRIADRIWARARWLNIILITFIGGWIIERCWALAGLRPAGSEMSSILTRVRELFGLHVLSTTIACLLVYWIRGPRSMPAISVICVALISVSLLFLPSAFAGVMGRGEIDVDPAEFSDWRNAIPPDSNVLVLPSHNSAKFAWFTLERPSYLTVDQSSGVVFSRATALEVRRRSLILLPLMSPDWMLLSNMASARSVRDARPLQARPLTRDQLTAICADPQLDFVVAREDVGFEPIRHDKPGLWKGLNLYDCRRVNAAPWLPNGR